MLNFNGGGLDHYDQPAEDPQPFEEVIQDHIQNFVLENQANPLFQTQMKNGRGGPGFHSDLVTNFLFPENKAPSGFDYDLQLSINQALSQPDFLMDQQDKIQPVIEEREELPLLFDQNLVLSDHNGAAFKRGQANHSLIRNQKFQSFIMGKDKLTVKAYKQNEPLESQDMGLTQA